MKILALLNNCKLSEADNVRLRSGFAKLKLNTPLSYDIEWKTINLPLTYKSFDATSDVKGLYGLDGAKQQIRDLGIVTKEYDIVIHFYSANTEYSVAYWTFPNPLYLDEVYIEIPINDGWGSLEKAICHEHIHAFHRMLNWKGIRSEDTMDRYDGDTSPMSGANYQRNLTELSKYWEQLLPSSITSNITSNTRKNTEYLIIHHTGSVNDTFENVKRYHISKGWGDIAYHYFIEKNGEIKTGRPEQEIGTHCKADGMNFKSIGICLNGNFEIETPTPEQQLSLSSLINKLSDSYHIPETNIIGHGKVKGAITLCPGKNLQTFLENRKRSLIIDIAKKVIALITELLRKKQGTI